MIDLINEYKIFLYRGILESIFLIIVLYIFLKKQILYKK